MKVLTGVSFTLALALSATLFLSGHAPAMSNPTAAHWVAGATSLSPKGGWSFISGDFNAVGKHDVAGYYPNGTIWVGQNNGSNFSFGGTAWVSGLWPADGWTFQSGAFAGDAKSDVVGYHPYNGSLWVGTNTGSAFSFGYWGTLIPADGWTVLAADMSQESPTNLGRSDAVVYHPSNGILWIGVNHGTHFGLYQWGSALPGNSTECLPGV